LPSANAIVLLADRNGILGIERHHVDADEAAQRRLLYDVCLTPETLRPEDRCLLFPEVGSESWLRLAAQHRYFVASGQSMHRWGYE